MLTQIASARVMTSIDKPSSVSLRNHCDALGTAVLMASAVASARTGGQVLTAARFASLELGLFSVTEGEPKLFIFE